LAWDKRYDGNADLLKAIRDTGNKIGRFLFLSGMTYEDLGARW